MTCRHAVTKVVHALIVVQVFSLNNNNVHYDESCSPFTQNNNISTVHMETKHKEFFFEGGGGVIII